MGLVLLSGLALLSRFWAIDHKSLFLDEAYSWHLANASLKNMFNLTAHDEHPPLYYGVLHFWVGVAGNSEASLRAPSAVFGAATVVLLAVVSWRTGGRLLALAAALLLLLNAAHLDASQEVRMYALVGFLALASSVAMAAFMAKPSISRFIPYAALDILLIYTHYSGLIAVGIQGLVFAVYGLDSVVRNRSSWILLAGLVLVGLLSLAYIPWWSTFRAQADVGVTHIPQPSLALVRDASRSLLGLEEAKSGWLVLALPILVLGSYGIARRWRNPYVLSVGAIALVPIAQILVSVWYRPIFELRQARPYVPGLAFVSALGFVEAAALFRQLKFVRVGYAAVMLAGVVMVVLMSLSVERIYRGPSFQDWRSAAADLHGAPVYVAPGYQRDPLAYYRGSTFAVTPFWNSIMDEIDAGSMPVPRDQETMLILQGARAHALLPAFKKYFDVQPIYEYAGWITIYRLRPLAAGVYAPTPASG